MADQAQSQDVEKEKLPLSKAVEFVLDECRMVLDGNDVGLMSPIDEKQKTWPPSDSPAPK